MCVQSNNSNIFYPAVKKTSEGDKLIASQLLNVIAILDTFKVNNLFTRKRHGEGPMLQDSTGRLLSGNRL